MVVVLFPVFMSAGVRTFGLSFFLAFVRAYFKYCVLEDHPFTMADRSMWEETV